MVIQWDQLKERFNELEGKLLQPSLDTLQRQDIQKEHSYLKNLLDRHEALESANRELAELKEQSAQAHDPALAELYAEEIGIIEQKVKNLQEELDEILYPPDPLDDTSVFLEVRAGTGGQEAALFAGDLLKMYTNYALKKGWEVSLVDSSSTDLGGIREAILHIQGKKVYAHLKYESGVHRVQRVPQTETAGRIHTSTATVAVLPEGQEVDVALNPADLRIDTYRASGAGGQHVNKTDSAVRITHIPSGLVVACQDERSQHKNRAKAMKIIQARLVAAQKDKLEAEQSQKRKEMVGGAMRSEKVRTYNYPQNRITDHQIDMTLKKLDMVMEGNLDEIVDELMLRGRQERKKQQALAALSQKK
ncbi:MAG: peptide chain release factor 1 [Solirubrobacteraceae bacterium]